MAAIKNPEKKTVTQIFDELKALTEYLEANADWHNRTFDERNTNEKIIKTADGMREILEFMRNNFRFRRDKKDGKKTRRKRSMGNIDNEKTRRGM